MGAYGERLAARSARLLRSGIRVYTMRHVDELGMATVARHALDRLRHLPRLHVSLDMDSLEPDEAPGVGTPVPGGLTYREAHLLMEILGDSNRVRSLDIVEVNPILDNGNRTADRKSQTSRKSTPASTTTASSTSSRRVSSAAGTGNSMCGTESASLSFFERCFIGVR